VKLFITLFLFTFLVTLNAQQKDLSQKPDVFNTYETIGGGGTPIPFAAFSESFEGTTFPPAGWLKASPDGGTGWERITAGTTPLPGWNGGTAVPPHAGAGTGMAYATWTTGGASSNNQWLITPLITNVEPGDSLTFWVRKFGAYIDNMHVRISTTAQTVAAMTVVVANLTWTVADSGWVRRSYEIGSLVPTGSNIYIGFREYVADNFNDGAALFLDDINVIPVIPVELTSFTATANNGFVNLTWTTATEVNNKGFEVQRKSDGSYVTVAFVEGKGTTTEFQNYSYNDEVAAGSYTYRLRQVDYDGKASLSDEVNVDAMGVVEFGLAQNYPNPFNPATVINYSIAVDSKVSLKIFNLLGQEVAQLVNTNNAAGNYSVNFDASMLNSGVYFYQLEAVGIDGTNHTSAKKMILTK
jgi:hypothetical protein